MRSPASHPSGGRSMRIRAARIASTAAALTALAASATLLSAVPAGAAPSNSPNLTTGTANCGSAGTYTFVASGNNGKGTSWNVAFVTASDGSHAVFHPDSFDLTFTTPDGQAFPQNVTKHKGPGPVS